jgi:hypothetical protein
MPSGRGRKTKNLPPPRTESGDDMGSVSALSIIIAFTLTPRHQPPPSDHFRYEDQPQSQSQPQTQNPPPSQMHSIAEHNPASIAFSNSTPHRPTLPPFSTLLQTTPGSALTHNPSYFQASAPPQSAFPVIGHLHRPALAISHVRTSSIASSAYTSSSAYGRPAPLSASIASGASSESVLTPDHFSAGRGIPWQSANPSPRNVGSSGGSVSSAAVGASPQTKSKTGTASRPRPLPNAPTGGNTRNPLPSVPAPAISEVSQHVAVPTEFSTASAPPDISGHTPTPASDARSLPKVPRTGGPAYADEAERKREKKNWRLHEDGYLVHWFCEPRAPRERLIEALAPQTPHGPQPCHRSVFYDVSTLYIYTPFINVNLLHLARCRFSVFQQQAHRRGDI